MTTARILHFSAGGRRCALSIDHVAELAEIQRIEPVPGAAADIAGLCEHRGRIVTLLSLAAPDTPGAPPAEGPATAVLLAGAYAHLGILVSGRTEDVATGWRAATSAGTADQVQPTGARERKDEPGSSDAAAWVEEPPRSRSGGQDDTPGFPVLLEDGRPVLLIDPEVLAERCTDHVRRRRRMLEQV